MERRLGELVAVTPLRRYIVFGATGIALMALLVFGMLALVYAMVVDGFKPISVVGLILATLLFYSISSLTFMRRAKVHQNGIVPSLLPFAERFALHSPTLHREDISEIRNSFAGKRIIGIVFETHDGKKYGVTRGDVGNKVFDYFLEFKRRFYSE